MLAQGTTKLAWVPTIASVSMMPTLAEITGSGSLNSLGNFTSSDDFQLGAVDDDALDEVLLSAAFNPTTPERTNYVAGLTVYRGGVDQPNADGEKAWTQRAVSGEPGFLIIRLGLPGEISWAPGDVVSVYQVISGDGQALTPDGSSHRFRWPFHVQDVNERTSVNVLTFRGPGYL